MKRKLCILLAWENFSRYYSEQIAETIKEEYDTDITDKPDTDFSKYDAVMSFFPQRHPGCQEKLVKLFFEPHEMGLKQGKVNVACSVYSHQMLLNKDLNALRVPFGVNINHFYPQPFPEKKTRVGWCGEALNNRKQFKALEGIMKIIPDVDFIPHITKSSGGITTGSYEKVNDMVDYYKQIHIYVCSSGSEGFGLPLLEASACGRPIITFDVGIAKELKQDGAGVIIVNNFIEMRREIISLAKDKKEIEELGEKSAKAVLASWQWKHFRAKWLEVFNLIK